MTVSQDSIWHRTLPKQLFEQIGQLLQHIAQAADTEVLLITEAVLTPIPILPESQLEQKFTLLVSPGFNVLLTGEPTATAVRTAGQAEFPSLSPRSLLRVKLMFEPEAIAQFLDQLHALLQHHPPAQKTLSAYSQTLQPNDAKLQSKFALELLSILVPEPDSEPEPSTIYPHVSVCQPVENALWQQIAHERLLNQVTTQIRQSLELPVILATAVNRVREFLQLDRLVIYQFEESGGRRVSSSPHLPHQDLAQLAGCVVYEARATDSIPSVLNYREERCFLPNAACWEKYRQGFTLVIDDIDQAYALSRCLLKFLKAVQVRAKLTTPIVFQTQLWGLLIAHQCTAPRSWQENDKNLLRQIAEQLAIAIHQAELMRSLTLEKQTLEQRVAERTQALHDALIAAQSASRAKSEFLATMSHELRTPLTRVIGMSATLLRWSLGELSQKQRHYLQTIHDSGQHLLSLINDILDLSQLQAGKAGLNISEFSLIQLAQSCWRSLLNTAQLHAVNLQLDLQVAPSRERFSADPQRVQQILSHLISNGIKFTPPNGQVILRVWLEPEMAAFQVEDTGIGIPTEQLPLLFEKFQQLTPPYYRHYQGIGLGLALTKQLVELLQGRIEVESTVGVGSSFTVWLPAISPSSPDTK